MRNFWIEVLIDGHRTVFAGGPQAKDGGFVLRVFQRDNGTSVKTLTVEGHTRGNGEFLCLDVCPHAISSPVSYDEEGFQIETPR